MGADDELVECAFLVPLVRNSDRQSHRPMCWNALEDALYREFGGHTGPELIYRAIRPVPGDYLAVVPRGRLDILRRILRQAANTFDQETIYLSVAGVVEFVRGIEEDGFLV